MNQSRDDLVKYRLSRAYESIEEAKVLAESVHWNTVANRLYYAAFYAVSALLVKNEILATTHSGVKSNFHKHYIKTNMVEKRFGQLYNNLFNKRQEGDYQDFQFFEADAIQPLIGKTIDLVKAIDILLFN
jgi:uncharacterized protein (UPF0332 family)